jgi:hypothetical protein
MCIWTAILAHPPEDIEINGVSICHVEHADDILIASRGPPGFQNHLNGAQFKAWSNNNYCETSIAKYLYQIFGPRQKACPSFHLCGRIIKLLQKAWYLGIWDKIRMEGVL